MKRFGQVIVKKHILVLVVAVLLVLPAVMGIIGTKINYDMLSYLPKDLDTVKGAKVLKKEFGKGAFVFLIFEGMKDKQLLELKEKIKKVKHVNKVIWYDDVVDVNMPREFLSKKTYKMFNSGNSTVMAAFLDTDISDVGTTHAIKEIKSITRHQVLVSGMASAIMDSREVIAKQKPLYVGMGALLAALVLILFTESFLLPFVLMTSIGLAILYNMGTNSFFGEISFITASIASILQLAVTMDYSIFLWHEYKREKIIYPGDKQRAMSQAIHTTASVISGSSLTTVAGFIALCFMTFTLGVDMGLVMAKGVVLGVLASITILPALILMFDGLIEKTSHRGLLPDFSKLSKFIVDKRKIFAVLAGLILVPALFGYFKVNVYYDLLDGFPKNLHSIKAGDKLKKEFGLMSNTIILVDKNMNEGKIYSMVRELENVDGIKNVIGYSSLKEPLIPDEAFPKALKDKFVGNEHQMLLLPSAYKPATDEANKQTEKINQIVQKYDKKGMALGEVAATKRLVEVTDTDFKNVNVFSALAVFLIIFFVMRSFSLPVILIFVIQVAIFINLGIPYYTNYTIPFIAPIIIGSIQLGATVDYALLLTNKYLETRRDGLDKLKSAEVALKNSIKSIISSGMALFAATVGVAIISDIDQVRSLCQFMSRGAIISMIMVIFLLPALLVAFDKLICYTTKGFKKVIKGEQEHKLAN